MIRRLRNWLARVLNVRHTAALWTSSRTRIPGTPQDARLDLAACDRLKLVNLSRHWEINSPLAAKLGSIFEQYTVGEDGLPVSPASSSEEFNVAALEYWQESEPFLDIGTMQGFRNMQAVSAWRWFFDGQAFWLKTRGESGFPRLQLIETHRIGTPDKLRSRDDIIDGIQIDPRTGRPLAYFIAAGEDAKDFRAIPAGSIIPIQEHTRARGLHSVPFLSPCLNDLTDLHELQHFEMLAAKDAAEITNVIYNQIGEAPPGGLTASRYSEAVTVNTGEAVTEAKADYYRDKVGGRSLYLQIGDKLEQFSSNRPSVASQQFWDFLTSKICAGCGISKLLVYPWSMQGTVTRADLDSQAAFFRGRSAVMIQAVRQAYEYVIFAGINSGRLPNPPKDWRRVNIRPPRNVNVDVGRNSNAKIAELKAGGTTFQDWYSELGMDWRAKLTQRAEEAAFIAQLAKGHGIDAAQISDIMPETPDPAPEPTDPAPDPKPATAAA